MIEDEKGLVSIDTFRKMFFTYFKGERQANLIYEMLQPAVCVHFDEKSQELIQEGDPRANESNKFVRI